MTASTRASDIEASLMMDLGTIERRISAVLRGAVPGVDAPSWRIMKVLDGIKTTKKALKGCLQHSED